MNRLDGAANGAVLQKLRFQLKRRFSHRLHRHPRFASVEGQKGAAEITTHFFYRNGPRFVLKPIFFASINLLHPFLVGVVKQCKSLVKK